MRVRGLQVAPFHVHVAGPLEVLLRLEGRQRNAPEDARKGPDRRQAGPCPVRRQAQAREGPSSVESEDTDKIAKMLEMGEVVTKKCNKIVDKFQTSESNLAKQQRYALQNQKLLMKEIRRLRKSNKKDVKKARNALTRVMHHMQIFADSIEEDKGVPHNQKTSFFGPLTKMGKEDSSLGGDGAKAVFAMAKDIVAKHAAEENDDDDSDVEMAIDGLIPMSGAGIMDYETPDSPRNFKGSSSVRRIAHFKENFDDTDKPGQKDDESDEEEEGRRRRRRRRRSSSQPDLVELSSQRRGKPPSWRIQPARELLLYRNGTCGLLDARDRFVCGSLLRGMRRAKLGRRSDAQMAPSRAARPLFCIIRDQKAGSFSRPARAKSSRRLHMRHFARAVRSTLWLAFFLAGATGFGLQSGSRAKTGECGHIFFACTDGRN